MEAPASEVGWKDRFWAWPRLSLAARIACVLCCALICTALVTWRIYIADSRRIPWWDYLNSWQWIVLGCLMATIFVSVYWAIRLWKEDYPTSDRSIETAWQAGLRAIAKSGREIERTPLYLLMGCQDSATALGIVVGGGCRLTEAPVPSGDPPIQWFFCEDRVFLRIHSPSLFSETARRIMLKPSEQETPAMSAASKLLRYAARVPLCSTTMSNRVTDDSTSILSLDKEEVQGTQEMADNEEAFETVGVLHSSDQGNLRQALNARQAFSHATAIPDDAVVSTMESAARSTGKTRGISYLTEALFHRMDELHQWLSKADRPSDSVELDPSKPSLQSLSSIHSRELSDETELFDSSEHEAAIVFERSQPLTNPSEERLHCHQLSEVMRRLRCLRGPVLGTNSLLVCLDAEQLADQGEMANHAGQALRKDLEVIRREVGVEASIHFLVHGMERLEGFTELARRLGPRACQSHSLGESFPLNKFANQRSIDAWLNQSIRNVVLAAYGGLISKPTAPIATHHQLFQLVIRTRGCLAQSLRALLRGLVGDTQQTVPMISTFAFAASGTEGTEKAFLVPVFSMMDRHSDAAGWTQETLRREKLYRHACILAKTLCFVFVAILLVQTVIAVRG